MKLEPLTPDDAEGALALWNRAAAFDPLTPTLLAEKVWEDPGFQPELVVKAAHEGQLMGFVHAVIRKVDGAARGIIKLFAVAPEHQRQGIGSQLLDQTEERLAGAGVTEIRAGESPPNYLVPGVDLRYAPAISFFTHRGYEPFAQAVNLEVDLTTWKPSDSAPAGDELTILRRATAADTEPLRQLILDHWPLWWGEVSQALANDPPTLFVAAEGDRVIGFAAHDANNRGTGWFGPMGTDPECQGRGLGKRLLDLALGDMQNQGHPRAVIPWVGPADFYVRHAGARPSRQFQRFRKPR